MSALTEAIAANGFGRAPEAKIHYKLPEPGTDFIAIAEAGSSPDNSLTVKINPLALGKIRLLLLRG